MKEFLEIESGAPMLSIYDLNSQQPSPRHASKNAP